MNHNVERILKITEPEISIAKRVTEADEFQVHTGTGEIREKNEEKSAVPL